MQARAGFRACAFAPTGLRIHCGWYVFACRGWRGCLRVGRVVGVGGCAPRLARARHTRATSVACTIHRHPGRRPIDARQPGRDATPGRMQWATEMFKQARAAPAACGVRQRRRAPPRQRCGRARVRPRAAARKGRRRRRAADSARLTPACALLVLGRLGRSCERDLSAEGRAEGCGVERTHRYMQSWPNIRYGKYDYGAFDSRSIRRILGFRYNTPYNTAYKYDTVAPNPVLYGVFRIIRRIGQLWLYANTSHSLC